MRPLCTCTSPSGDDPKGHAHSCPRRVWLETAVGSTPPEKCAGSQAFPTAYNGEYTRCPVCNRRLKLHVNGKVPNHNPEQPSDYRPYERRNNVG